MSKECLKESGMSKVLKALDIANKRIDELEKYNLDLANESHNKSLAIERANERVAELESENTNGNAAAELLIWWAQKLSSAPNEDLKEVVRIGYKRIVNLANLIGEEQLRKGGE